MSNSSLLSVLMRRDGLSRSDALEQINDARQQVLDGANPEEVLYDEFQLEPDFVFDLI